MHCAAHHLLPLQYYKPKSRFSAIGIPNHRFVIYVALLVIVSSRDSRERRRQRVHLRFSDSPQKMKPTPEELIRSSPLRTSANGKWKSRKGFDLAHILKFRILCLNS
ncbi:hypothetical protein AAC387_Pa02g2413 [Persea americana]